MNLLIFFETCSSNSPPDFHLMFTIDQITSQDEKSHKLRFSEKSPFRRINEIILIYFPKTRQKPEAYPPSKKTLISFNDFLCKSGTIISSEGNPTGIRIKALSFSGRPNNLAKKFIGLGVCVRETRPAL